MNLNRRILVDRRHAQDIPMLDMLQIMSGTPGMYMDGPQNPVYTNVSPTYIDFVKNPAGFPCDRFLIDDQFIYMFSTENGSLGWPPNGSAGNIKVTHGRTTIPFCRRYAHDGDVVVATNTQIDVYANCKLVPSSIQLGKVQCEIHLATETLGGTLPANLPVVQVEYRWNGQASGIFLTMETFSYSLSWHGLVHWKSQAWDSIAGVYWPPTAGNESIFNVQKPGSVKSLFPCTV